MRDIYLSVLFLQLVFTCQTLRINIGTVLFTEYDLECDCINFEKSDLLVVREILDDLIPKTQALVDREFVNDIINYFQGMYKFAAGRACGQTKHILFQVITDIIGGYLYHVAIPEVKHAYYKGSVDYTAVEKLIQLFEECKWYLKTNGYGWTAPKEFDCVEALEFDQNQTEMCDSCQTLVFFDKGCPKDIMFPLPFFDRASLPQTISIPFRFYSVRPIDGAKADSIVAKFFLAVINCYEEKGVDHKIRLLYYNRLYTWIENEVLPKLNDYKFYSAFGKILRVHKTLKKLGATKINIEESKRIYMHYVTQQEGLQQFEIPVNDSKPSKFRIFSSSELNIIFLPIIAIILLWILLVTLFTCFRLRSCQKPGPICEFAKMSNPPSMASFTSLKKTCKPRTKCVSRSGSTINSTVSEEFVTAARAEIYPLITKRGHMTAANVTIEEGNAMMERDSRRSKRISFADQNPDAEKNSSFHTSRSSYDLPCIINIKSQDSSPTTSSLDHDSNKVPTIMTNVYADNESKKSSSSFTASDHKPVPKIFGYDFQTSSSSVTSDSDIDEIPVRKAH